MTSKSTGEQATDTEIQMLIDSHEKGTVMFMRTDAYYFMAKELQERRKADSEPVAYLVCNGRLYQDRPFLSLSAARISVNDRNDGAEIKALCVIETLTEAAE